MLYREPTKHRKTRRAQFHDYSAPGTYMVTIVAKDRRQIFGTLEFQPQPHIALSPLGRAVETEEFRKIHEVYPMVFVWRKCIMPDHIHMILHVSERLPDGRKLGHVINGFKNGCNKAFWRLVEDTGVTCFQPKYNDLILFNDGQLGGWKHYLDDNPRRLAIKLRHPDYFTVIHDTEVCGHRCQVVGNRFLLDIPDKMAVVVHRADSDEVFNRKKAEWLACGERGGVLVSAAIAPREKDVLHEAMSRGYKIIWLRENGFPALYKPAGRTFDACASGQLLEISPNDYHFDRRTITRAQCLELNRLAEAIAASYPSLFDAQ